MLAVCRKVSCLQENFEPIFAAMPSAAGTTTKISNLLPTGTFLTFQVLAPLATNNGQCGVVEKVITSVVLGALAAGCILTSFTDSYTAPDGKVYLGFVTHWGLWVPNYHAAELVGGTKQAEQTAHVAAKKPSGGPTLATRLKKRCIDHPEFHVNPSDWINASLSVLAFLTLTLFTDPVSTCFYPNLSATILKTVPVLMAATISFFCSFAGKVRHGYGNSFPGSNYPPGYTPVKDQTHELQQLPSTAV